MAGEGRLTCICLHHDFLFSFYNTVAVFLLSKCKQRRKEGALTLLGTDLVLLGYWELIFAFYRIWKHGLHHPFLLLLGCRLQFLFSLQTYSFYP